MDQDLIAFLNARFSETSQRIASLREEVSGLRKEFEIFRADTAQRFEKVEAEVQHAHTKYGGLSRVIDLFGGGMVTLEERLQIFRAEMKQEFEETRGLMRSAYAQVDHRMLSLEAFKARRDRDPIEVIREHYGKTKISG
jgi:predicted  nucleic acid-binding Zn-ribbon protein